MNLFNDLLEKISKRLQGNELYKLEIAKKITDIIGINIEPDQIEIKNNKLFLSISPTIKSLVFLKKDKILKELSLYKINSIV